MSDYYCLVAGLPDIVFDGSKINFSIENFKEDIYPNLSDDDACKIDLFFFAWDNDNLMRLLRFGNEAELKRIGRFDREELVELIMSVKSGDMRNNKYPAYMYDFLEEYFENESHEDFLSEDLLAARYYAYAMNCGNAFLANWFEFNLNINNLQVAFLARKYKLNVADCIVGDNEICEALRSSGARDFGLSGTVEYLETVQHLCETDKLQEREHQLDELRWNWLDDNSSFMYFSMERLFVFLQKTDIVTRWAKLDAETGMLRYKELIDSLKSGLTFKDEDFQ